MNVIVGGFDPLQEKKEREREGEDYQRVVLDECWREHGVII